MTTIKDAHGNEYIIKRKKKSRGLLETLVDAMFLDPLEMGVNAGIKGAEYAIRKGADGVEALAKKGTDATCKQLDRWKR